MRVVVQRVSEASVVVDGETIAAIGAGLVVLVGIAATDGEAHTAWMAGKVAGLRIFADASGRMNASVDEIGGTVLAVSQFTLLGDASKGRRPSFGDAMEPERAERLFDHFVAALATRVGPVPTGRFGASMQVQLINDGPVTLVIDH